MKNNPLPRLDIDDALRQRILPHCRLRPGQTWLDPKGRHRIACADAAGAGAVQKLMNGERADLAIHDPPYNLVAFEERGPSEYIEWCKQWVNNSITVLKPDSSFYVWLGADQRNGFQPLPDFMMMMRETALRPRSFITMRNQRGYGTQKNWMAVRQELLYYIKGDPDFNIEAEYTDIPKILRGYYKEVGGKTTENFERSKSENIRAGNVWVDVQQVFYRMEENVSGCYAQKPLKCIERIVKASSPKAGLVVDFFAHSGTTLLAAELNHRRCFTADNDPVFCEIAIRRLEHFRATGRLGWQNGHPFEKELPEFGAEGAAPSVESQIEVQLQAQLDELLALLKNEAKVKARVETLVSVYPFNEFEYIISTLLGAGVLTLDAYCELREAYITRNKNLEIFQITAPTAFGITWAQDHVQKLVPELQKPSKRLDRYYSGEYDFFLKPSIRIEVKASRAVAYKTKGPLYSKALASNSNKQFEMNFQQLKPECCDVFVWIAVWLDVIRYWVMASREVESHPDYSPQHRGGEESQLHIKRENLAGFQKYEVGSLDLLEAVRNAHKRQAVK